MFVSTQIDDIKKSFNLKGFLDQYRIRCYFLSIILLIFIGAFHQVLTFIAFAAAGIAAVFIGVEVSKRPSPEVPIGIVYLLVFQNLCIGVGAHLFGNTSIRLMFLTQIPFLCIFTIWIVNEAVILCKHMFVLRKRHICFIVLCVCIVIAGFHGNGSIPASAVYIRNITVFFMAFEIGRMNIRDQDEVYYVVHAMLKLGIFVFITGVILLIAGYELYRIIGMKEVYIAKGQTNIPDALEPRFRSSVYRKTYVRMGSILYEPVNLGYIFSCMFLCAIFFKKLPRHYVYAAFIGLGLLLSIGKGGYLITILTIFCVLADMILRKCGIILQRTRFIILITAALCLAAAFSIFYYLKVNTALVGPHFEGIIGAFRSLTAKPFGYGLGTGGNMSLVFDNAMDTWHETGGESGLMAIMYQIGFQGGLALAACFISLIPRFKENENAFECMFYYLPIIIFGISIFQENTFTPQCIVPFMLLQGGAGEVSSFC